MKIPIVCRDVMITANTVGLCKIDGKLKIIADMSDDQMKDLFYEIWSKVGDDEIEKWLGFEGFGLTKPQNI